MSIIRDPFTWLRVLAKLRLNPFDPLEEIEQARRERIEPEAVSAHENADR